jgi:NADH-quinone oxidoreductase subunit A
VPESALNDYMPVVLLAAFAVGFAALNVGLSWALGKRVKGNRDKDLPFECGMLPLEDFGRRRFPVKFYVVAVLFILFDVEVVFLYPWAVRYKALGMFGFVEMLLFLGVLAVGWWYVVAKGALDWAPQRRVSRPVMGENLSTPRAADSRLPEVRLPEVRRPEVRLPTPMGSAKS